MATTQDTKTTTTKKRKSKIKLKGEQAPQKKLEGPGDSIIGFFQGFKIAMLADESAPNGKKPVRYYHFTEEDDEKKRFVVSGRLMLDEAFDEVCRQTENGIDGLMGELIQFTRLPDTKLTGKKRMGNFEIEVFETES